MAPRTILVPIYKVGTTSASSASTILLALLALVVPTLY